jgi:integrase
MARDALTQLDLPRDPTVRVRFPERPDRSDANALSPDGRVGPVSRKKRAPREIPLPKQLWDVLHRQRMIEQQEAGVESGWVFPSDVGKLREPGSLRKAWQGCLRAAKIKGHFTVHGMRRTFNDLARRAGVDAVVTRSITGHVTEQMREHYSTIGVDEKHAAVASVLRLVPTSKVGT